MYAGRFTAMRFKEEFLKSFMRGRTRPVLLVVGGHPAHRAKLIASYVTQLKGRLELQVLPGYAPELNPDEFVWHDVTREGPSKKPLTRNESLRQRVEGAPPSRVSLRWCARSFERQVYSILRTV